MSWVNAQLRKKPGLKPVSDLRQDLRDGVVLAHLIEIVGKCIHHIPQLSQDSNIMHILVLRCVLFIWLAGELLDGIHYVPRDDQEKKQNVEKVLQFVSSKRIRMPQTSARGELQSRLLITLKLIDLLISFSLSSKTLWRGT